ncbi:hypothetical protein ACMAZE_03635 [Pseudopelagicola sp. nBUS_20]|uniref:LuxE/PaaK family acyltransferase n=1 Tax=Pseudopelagicola sp. nBUS_20 TaxID=3395317 RepID=UPI003EBB4C1C
MKKYKMENVDMLVKELSELTHYHKNNCNLYSYYVSTFFKNLNSTEDLKQIPYLPVRAFKEFELKSIKNNEVFKIMTSSGTSGQFSKIFLDKSTAQLQSKTLVRIFADTFGNGRYPMLIIDSEMTVRNRQTFSARTAAINGFSMFSRKRCFALNSEFKIDFDAIAKFLCEHKGQRIFVFGFTFLIWKNFIQEIRTAKRNIDLENAFILHGGGWKKLQEQSVSNDRFKDTILETTGCSNVRNYYGMVEQTGTIFMECEYGRLHACSASGALTRSRRDFSVLPDGHEGIIQIFSTIQRSYPGHSLLTEDVGSTTCNHDCPCGQKGAVVSISGRLQKAEVRGCSDAYS